MGALARSNLLPGEEVLINDEHDIAEVRVAKRPRTLNNPQGVAIEQQLSEIASSGGGGGAMPAASALQPARSMGIVVGRQDSGPLYAEDASAISGLEDALIKAGWTKGSAYARSLHGFSRWVFANNKPSIVGRVDSKSLTDGSDVLGYIGKSNDTLLLKAIDHLRTWWSTGTVPIARRSKRNPHPQNVAPIHSESAVRIEPRRLDNAVAQLSASSAPQPAQSTGIVRGQDMRPLSSEDAPVVLGLEEALIKAGTRRLDIAAAQLSASSALVTGPDMRPLYFEDARDISGLQEAFIEAGMSVSTSRVYASFLRSFSRWLLAKNKPSLVAQLDSESLSGDVSGFIGTRNPAGLLMAIDYLRTFRSTGTIALPRAERNPAPPDVAPIRSQSAVLVEPRLIGDAAAQHSASQEAGSRREELREVQEDQPAPSPFEEHVAFDQELRRVLDHQPILSPVFVPSEELQRLENDLEDELHARRDDHATPSFSADPEELTFNLEQFSPGELRRLLDDPSILSPLPVDPEDSTLNSGQSPPPKSFGDY
ncbi:hypothetical protein [Bradyrhizobium sp. NBAIM08]|uniref:hypothetical protein n=1 Tax=Bradyrhizobium sp. NBAIM08 TaxID=2793815 RepID=UPI001CD67BB2|nr:hypothetical protein [Bradyrhizobium sp. NBAIM08]